MTDLVATIKFKNLTELTLRIAKENLEEPWVYLLDGTDPDADDIPVEMELLTIHELDEST